MGLKRLAAKVSDYNERLEQGKASKIEPAHVQEVLEKLRRKAEELDADIADAPDPEKKARLSRKRDIARQHIARAEWLLTQIG